MICRKCGSVLEKGTKVCPFCEEMAESDADNLMPQTREEKDSRAIGDGMPPLVRLKELAAIPEEQDRLMDELHRLHDYFEQIKGKYGILGDLWLMQAQYKEPSLGHWIWGGGLLTLFIYMIMSGVVSGLVSTFFFVLWLLVTAVGYIRSGRRYKHRKAELDADIRAIENEVRIWYNQAEHCFLPLDYSDPRVIHDLIAGLRNGAIGSFRDYRPVE